MIITHSRGGLCDPLLSCFPCQRATASGLTQEEKIDFIYFFFFFIYFNWMLITLQYCGGFCHAFTWISHGCTCVPHPEPPFHLPPHPIHLGHPSAPAPSTLSHASDLDWQSISHMIIYMFQCYPLKSPHHCLLPLHFILSNNDQAVLGGSDSKESSCNAGHSSSIPGSEWSPGGGYRKPL